MKDRVAEVRDRVAKNGVITAADLHEAGGALADESGERIVCHFGVELVLR